jgi:hypothetical protein
MKICLGNHTKLYIFFSVLFIMPDKPKLSHSLLEEQTTRVQTVIDNTRKDDDYYLNVAYGILKCNPGGKCSKKVYLTVHPDRYNFSDSDMAEKISKLVQSSNEYIDDKSTLNGYKSSIDLYYNHPERWESPIEFEKRKKMFAEEERIKQKGTETVNKTNVRNDLKGRENESKVRRENESLKRKELLKRKADESLKRRENESKVRRENESLKRRELLKRKADESLKRRENERKPDESRKRRDDSLQRKVNNGRKINEELKNAREVRAREESLKRKVDNARHMNEESKNAREVRAREESLKRKVDNARHMNEESKNAREVRAREESLKRKVDNARHMNEESKNARENRSREESLKRKVDNARHMNEELKKAREIYAREESAERKKYAEEDRRRTRKAKNIKKRIAVNKLEIRRTQKHKQGITRREEEVNKRRGITQEMDISQSY